MDEKKRKSVLARRLALTLSLCCTISSSYAADPETRPTDSGSLSQLLSQGMVDRAATGSLAELIRESEHSSSHSAPAIDSEQLSGDAQRTSKTSTVEPEEVNRLPLVPSVIEGQALKPFAAAEDVAGVLNQPKVESLADFLRANRALIDQGANQQLIVGDGLTETGESDHAFVAPRRRSVPTHTQSTVRPKPRDVIVRSAPAIKADVTQQDRSPRHNPEPSIVAAKERPAPSQSKRSPIPRIETIPPRIVKVPPVLAKPPRQPNVGVQVDVAAKRLKALPPASVAVGTESLANIPLLPPVSSPLTSNADKETATQSILATDRTAQQEPIAHLQSSEGTGSLTAPVRMVEEASPEPERLRVMTADDGYANSPSLSLEIDEVLGQSTPPPLSSVSLRTTRLQEVAQRSLLKSQASLQRGATHTARKYAIEAIQAVVAMRDAHEGSNLHGRELTIAFDAIRESRDFCGEFGTVDPKALQRMVAVHETTALKEEDLSLMSGLQATEAYLDFARENLVRASGGVREASQALIMLGQIEFQVAKPVDSYAMSVAVEIQRASVEADPQYAIGYRVLGTTLLRLGLVDQAAACLITSLQLRPTRKGYERLHEVARLLGDADTARICLKALQDPRMDEGIPIRSLAPSEFAATHRPSFASVQASSKTSNRTSVQPQTAPASRLGFKSLFQFGRK